MLFTCIVILSMNIWKLTQANTEIHVKMFRYIYQYLYFFVQGEFMYKLCIKFLERTVIFKKMFLKSYVLNNNYKLIHCRYVHFC